MRKVHHTHPGYMNWASDMFDQWSFNNEFEEMLLESMKNIKAKPIFGIDGNLAGLSFEKDSYHTMFLLKYS